MADTELQKHIAEKSHEQAVTTFNLQTIDKRIDQLYADLYNYHHFSAQK